MKKSGVKWKKRYSKEEVDWLIEGITSASFLWKMLAVLAGGVLS